MHKVVLVAAKRRKHGQKGVSAKVVPVVFSAADFDKAHFREVEIVLIGKSFCGEGLFYELFCVAFVFHQPDVARTRAASCFEDLWEGRRFYPLHCALGVVKSIRFDDGRADCLKRVFLRKFVVKMPVGIYRRHGFFADKIERENQLFCKKAVSVIVVGVMPHEGVAIRQLVYYVGIIGVHYFIIYFIFLAIRNPSIAKRVW